MIRLFKKLLSKRFWLFVWQRRLRGWDDSDTWSLDWTVAKFILPRLKRFKELNDGHPNGFTEKSWDETIDKMIFAMEAVALGTWEFHGDNADENRIYWDEVQEGLDLFGKYFMGLWW